MYVHILHFFLLGHCVNKLIKNEMECKENKSKIHIQKYRNKIIIKYSYNNDDHDNEEWSVSERVNGRTRTGNIKVCMCLLH